MGKGRIAALAVALLATLLLLVSVDTRSAFAQELSLKDVTIQSFEIIDTTHGDAEIEYSLSSEASPKTDPAAFSNAICQNQTKSALRLEAKVAYDGSDAIQDGDTLAIPAKIGHSQDFASRPLVDGDGNQLGTFEYTDGKYLLKFSGDYIKDHSIKKFDATLQTGVLWNASDVLGRTTELGERALVKGTLGKDVLYAAYEKQYIVAQSIGTTKGLFGKASATSTNRTIEWGLEIYNDCQQINGRFFNNPYMLENDGAYSPNSYTGVYLEDTFADCTGAPEITVTLIPLGGINDQGKVLSWWYNANPPLNVLLTKVDQGTRSKSDVKDALQNGQHCMYDNQDGSYTFMLKWWDMNDLAGPKYDDIPEIAAAGGVGDYLKENFSDIFGGMSPATIEKINQIYAGKALQSLKVKIAVPYQVVNAPTGNFVITNAHTPKVNPTPEPGPAPDPSSPGSKPPASGHQGKSMPATDEGPVLLGILTLAAASLAGLAWAAKKRMRNEGGMQS